MYKEEEKRKIFEDAIERIKRDDNVLFLDDVVSELPITKPTFYAWWPKGSKEYDTLWQLVVNNRIQVKKYIRLKLRLSDRASELLSLYRMICTEEERRNISQNYTNVKADIDGRIEIGFVETDVSPVSSEEDVEL